MSKLNLQCIHQASKYFKSLDDFINIEKAHKKFRGNMELFKYNPISLDAKTKKFFPNIETYHLYEKGDRKIKTKKLKEYVICTDITYSKYLITPSVIA